MKKEKEMKKNGDRIDIIFCDVDGTLTDGTVYYSERGEELKQFSHRDGRAFHLLREEKDVRVYLVTSESGGINAARGRKFTMLGTIDGIVGAEMGEKKEDTVRRICLIHKIDLENAMFIGDDTNDLEAMMICGRRACPVDAVEAVYSKVSYISEETGGHGAVRDIIEHYWNQFKRKE